MAGIVVDISVDDRDDLVALYAWLRDDADLRVHTEWTSEPVSKTELGGTLELLTVALGSGGIGVALCHSLTAWLSTRKANVRIVVKTSDRLLAINAENVDDLNSVITQALDGNVP